MDYFPEEGAATANDFDYSCSCACCDVCIFGARKVAYYANRDVATEKCKVATREYLAKCFAEIDAIESTEQRTSQFIELVRVVMKEPPYMSYTCIYSIVKDICDKFSEFSLQELYTEFVAMYSNWL